MVQAGSIFVCMIMMLSANMVNPFSCKPPINQVFSWKSIRELNKNSSGAYFKEFTGSETDAPQFNESDVQNMIFVPGFADDIEVFTPLINHLISYWEQRNIRLNARGFTPPFQGNIVHQPKYVKPRGRMISFNNHYLDPVDKLVSSTLGEKPYLLGHSTGGTGIIVKILKQPEISKQLKGVVLLAPFLGLSMPKKPRTAVQKISSNLLPIIDSESHSVWQKIRSSLLTFSIGLPTPLAHVIRSLTAGIYQQELAKAFGAKSSKQFFLRQRDMAITGEWIIRVSAAQEYIANNIHRWPKDLPLLVMMYEKDTVVSDEALTELLQDLEEH